MKPQYVSPSATNSGCLAQTVRTVQGYNDISPEYSPDFNDLWLMNFMSQRWHLCTKCHGFFCHKFIQSAFEPISSFSNYSVLQHSLSITLFGEIPTFFFFFFLIFEPDFYKFDLITSTDHVTRDHFILPFFTFHYFIDFSEEFPG